MTVGDLPWSKREKGVGIGVIKDLKASYEAGGGGQGYNQWLQLTALLWRDSEGCLYLEALVSAIRIL